MYSPPLKLIPLLLASLISLVDASAPIIGNIWLSTAAPFGVMNIQTEQAVNVTTTKVEASVFTPLVSTAVAEVSETSLEATEFTEDGRGDIASPLIIAVLTILILYLIYRRRKLLRKH